MLSAVRLVAAEPEVRAVVVTGAGDAFSAGGDFGLIEQMQEDPGLRKAALNRSRSLFWSFVALEVPVIAAVNGPAVGAGATLALLSDIVLMAEAGLPGRTQGEHRPGTRRWQRNPLAFAGWHPCAHAPICSPAIACRRRRPTVWASCTEWWSPTPC